MNDRHVLLVGIASLAQSKARTIAIASGKHKRGPDEPRVWFTSAESLLKVLSSKNMMLLDIIRKAKPQSIAELAEMSGRAKPNVTRTLRRMQHLGIVDLEEHSDGRRVPKVNYDEIVARLPLEAA